MMELTILMPCLNERAAVTHCVEQACIYLQSRGIHGEVLVADNGSTDGSPLLARQAGARVVTAAETGYGHALRCGIAAAAGRYIIMGDCDGSYDFSDLDDMLAELRQGAALVVGDRFTGGIDQGAMPPSHRYIGVPLLSWLGRCRFQVNLRDFHCGLRGFSREAAQALEFRCGGMEFATELIGRFAEGGYHVAQVPVRLHPDLRQGAGHLRTLKDGLRHLLLLIFWKHI